MQLFREQSSSFDNPSLDIFLKLAGSPYRPSALAFEIWSTPTDGPDVQTYPDGGGQQSVDLDADQLEIGHYVAVWDVPADEPLTTHEIRWFINGAVSADVIEEFTVGDVVEVSTSFYDGYCSVQDCRDEGITEVLLSDDRLGEMIELASQEIDSLCRTWFKPRQRTFRLDGHGHAMLYLPAPPIIIESVELVGDRGAYDVDDIELVEPSPREGTRFIEMPALRLGLYGGYFPKGRRNVEVVGVFGYTEQDGTALGRVPLAIKRATIMLVALMAEKIGLSAAGGGGSGLGAAPVKQIKTADQTVTFSTESGGASSSGLSAPFTGNAALDMIISRYRMQGMGAV
ncbi:MAG: hypothetical protein KKH12_16120 [Gammaproteobacteria bacterium]|nr:hypothetical protein [Gammaproteobacteria bacterium]